MVAFLSLQRLSEANAGIYLSIADSRVHVAHRHRVRVQAINRPGTTIDSPYESVSVGGEGVCVVAGVAYANGCDLWAGQIEIEMKIYNLLAAKA